MNESGMSILLLVVGVPAPPQVTGDLRRPCRIIAAFTLFGSMIALNAGYSRVLAAVPMDRLFVLCAFQCPGLSTGVAGELARVPGVTAVSGINSARLRRCERHEPYDRLGASGSRDLRYCMRRAREGGTMNRKNLLELMVAIVVTAPVCGYASTPTPQHTADVPQEAAKELVVTRNAWEECVRAAIPQLDHPESTSDAVARAAMNSCADQYADMMRALSRTLEPTCGRDSDCTRNALAKAQSEATRAATDEVVTERIRVAGAQVLKCE
jgi:hypothetical protein